MRKSEGMGVAGRLILLLVLAPIILPLVTLMAVGLLAGVIANPIVMFCLKGKASAGPQIKPRGWMDKKTGEIPDFLPPDLERE